MTTVLGSGRHCRRGFTLVEVLVTAGILAALMTGLLLLFSSGGRTVRIGVETLDVISTTGIALEHLKRDLRGLHGESPLPDHVSPAEFTLKFDRLEGVDERSGQARLLPITYRFWSDRATGRAALVREADGRRTSLIFDREIALLVGTDANGAGVGRSLRIAFSFPTTASSGSRRPPIHTTALALNRGTFGDSPQPAGAPPLLRARPDRLWSADGTELTSGVAELFPADALPIRSQGEQRHLGPRASPRRAPSAAVRRRSTGDPLPEHGVRGGLVDRSAVPEFVNAR